MLQNLRYKDICDIKALMELKVKPNAGFYEVHILGMVLYIHWGKTIWWSQSCICRFIIDIKMKNFAIILTLMTKYVCNFSSVEHNLFYFFFIVLSVCFEPY